MIQELRIGNYVTHVHKGNFKILKSHFASLMINFIKPIPLTEDILLKCAKFYEEDSMKSKWFGIYINKEYYGIIELLPDGRVLYDGGFLQYLHEFQNAFYYGKNRKIELNIEL